MKKKIVACVSNDLVFDQRVRKVCQSLSDMGFELTLLGRTGSKTPTLERPYRCVRLRLFFKGGALFYAALNFRFFFFLLFHKCDIILANDLDTLPAAFLAGKIRGKKVVYDSHEYFTEAAGLTGRNFQKNVWLAIEKRIFPRLTHVYTVNESIASIYRDLYKVDVKVVRNIPPARKIESSATRSDLGLPADKPILLLQGAYIDMDRGAKELLLAMEYLPDMLLLMIGAGVEKDAAERMAREKGWEDRTLFLPKIPFEQLCKYTVNSTIGLSLDKPIHLNYKLSLPNKLFDYIQAGVPVVTSDLPELRRIQSQFEIGTWTPSHAPREIADTIRSAVEDQGKRTKWKQGLKEAAAHFTWQNEEKVLQEIYADLL